MKKTVTILVLLFITQFLFGQNHIHWGSTGDPLNGLVISWQSMETSNQIKWGYTTSYEQGSFPAIRRNDYSWYLYDYHFPALNPSSLIHYSIFNGNVWTQDKVFQTSVNQNSSNFSFIAGGDSRTNMDDWEIAASKLSTENVDFHLFLGDHVNSGSNTSDWDNWFDRGHAFLSKNLIYHTGGNHEYGSIYLNQFVLPGNEKWYSFEFGNAIFICLFSEEDFVAQHTWLVNELASSSKTWKFVFFHKPFFTTGSHANEMNSNRTTWWKAFDDYGVDVVLGGHTHYYLRSSPINLNISSNSAVSEYGSKPGQGRLQIVAGSYGAPRSSTGNAWFVEKNLSTMNYTKFEINDDVLEMNAYDMAGVLIDHVAITKDLTDIGETASNIRSRSSLIRNMPNPFKSNTVFEYCLSVSDYVNLKIFNMDGKEIVTLVDEFQTAGEYRINWQPSTLASGTYVYRLEIGKTSNTGPRFFETKKLIIQK